jgi:hypothetical protein
MIRYNLHCDTAHEFDAWFAGSAAFDQQAIRGLVSCPHCGSTKVEKSIMAPNVGTKGNRKADAVPVKAANADAAQHSPSFDEMRALVRRVRAEVAANAEYVGPRFVDEARKIHHEETAARGIYGEATSEDIKSLREDGIAFYPLPRLPEEQN